MARWTDLILLAAPLLASAGCSGGPSGPGASGATGDFQRRLRSGSMDRAYLLHVPSGIPPGATVPLVVAFHGTPSSAAEMRAITGFDALADERGFLVAYPATAEADWNTGCAECGSLEFELGIDDVRFARDVVADVTRDHPVDARRVYAAGFSNGALFTLRLACDASDLFAAFGAVGATALDPRFVPGCDAARPAPLAFVHGTADREFPLDGRDFTHDPDGLRLLSMDETLALWTGRDGCSGGPTTSSVPDTVDDGTSTRLDAWSCAGGAAVLYYRVEGGGHTWPGSPVTFSPTLGPESQDFSASAALMDFFLAHPR